LSNDGKVRILAVDDNPAKLLALSAILSELKETVVTASSGREALRLLLQQEFAVVLWTCTCPAMDGSKRRRSCASARAPSTRRSSS
jgi:CheY-like chemotaxis protein